jgi:hypothetical protein
MCRRRCSPLRHSHMRDQRRQHWRCRRLCCCAEDTTSSLGRRRMRRLLFDRLFDGSSRVRLPRAPPRPPRTPRRAPARDTPAIVMYHFINCILLAFAPHVIIFKATTLYAHRRGDGEGERRGEATNADGARDQQRYASQYHRTVRVRLSHDLLRCAHPLLLMLLSSRLSAARRAACARASSLRSDSHSRRWSRYATDQGGGQPCDASRFGEQVLRDRERRPADTALRRRATVQQARISLRCADRRIHTTLACCSLRIDVIA